MSRPIQSNERIHSLDVIRGIAICGVLLVNIIAMAGPQMGMMDPAAWHDPSNADLAVFIGVRIAIEGKFLSMFSLLFGIGLMLQTRRMESVDGGVGRYWRRIGLLAMMGTVHGLLLWWGDILLAYAIVASLAIWLRNVTTQTLGALAISAMLVGQLVMASALLSMAAIPPEATVLGAEMVREIPIADGAPAWMARVLDQPDLLRMFSAFEVGAFGEGGLLWSFGLRAALFLGTLSGLFGGYGFIVLSLFITGMWAVKSGFLDDPTAQGRVARWAVFIGLTLELLGSGLCALGGWHFNLAVGSGEALRTVSKPILAVGMFAGLLRVVGPGVPPTILAPFASAGRMALTNYLGQSVITVVLMSHWGFGWFGTMGRAQTFGLCLVILAFQLAASHLWLMRFSRGPMEALWRRGTYGRG